MSVVFSANPLLARPFYSHTSYPGYTRVYVVILSIIVCKGGYIRWLISINCIMILLHILCTNVTARIVVSIALLSLLEFQKIALATAIGFFIMGFIGYFVKLIHIPINNIIV